MLKCPECGHTADHDKFCAECGHHFDVADIVAEPTEQIPASAPASAPTPAAASNSRTPLIVAGALVALALVGGIAWFVVASGDKSTEFEKQVAEAMGPVLGANEALSEELEDLEGADTDDAKSAVDDLKDEVTRAEGRIEGLDEPKGDELQQLRRDALDALRGNERYVDAVEEVLAQPASSRADDLTDLEDDLVDALDTAGPTVAGDDDVVFSADELVDWASARVKAAAKFAADKRAKAKAAAERRQEELAAARAEGAASAAASSSYGMPSSGGTGCGGGLYAGANTTCAFAEIVRMSYQSVPETTTNVSAYSPVTRQTYTMYCRPSGGWILCTGGNNASVWF